MPALIGKQIYDRVTEITFAEHGTIPAYLVKQELSDYVPQGDGKKIVYIQPVEDEPSWYGIAGTIVHHKIEVFLSGVINRPKPTLEFHNKAERRMFNLLRNGPHPNSAEFRRRVDRCFEQWMTWFYSEGRHYKFIYLESRLICHEYGYVGTADAIALRDGSLTIFDWKTSRKMSNGYAAQVSAYVHALKESIKDGRIKFTTVIPVSPYAYTLTLGGNFKEHRVMADMAYFLSLREKHREAAFQCDQQLCVFCGKRNRCPIKVRDRG